MNDAVKITGIAAGGDGVGRMADGRAVFVPRTAPGDEVRLRAERVRLRRRWARGELGHVLVAAESRVEPPCPHYVRDRCGGCQLQHLAYEAQLAAKRALVGDALRRIGKLDVPDPEIVEAVEEWRYRTKISLSVARGGGLPGLRLYDQPASVFPLADCLITDQRLTDLWREVRKHCALLPDRLSRLTLRLDRDGRRHVIAESGGAPWQRADELRAALPQGHGVVCWWQPVEGAARVVAGPSNGYPATAFEQVNAEMGAVARRWAVNGLGELRGQVTWDLYGGTGDTAELLEARGAEVTSVDADRRAVEWAQRRRPAAGTRYVAGRAEELVETLPEPYAVVVNPPRTGLHGAVAERLASRPVPRVAYISCDPATLARDLSRLGSAYHLFGVRAFDLFPQTAHVETVALLAAR